MTVVDASKPLSSFLKINPSSLQDENDQLHDEAHQQSSDFQDSTPRADGTAVPITDSFSMSLLPAPEPTTFSGEPIQYPDWKSSFHALTTKTCCQVITCYLKQYISGSAKEAISGL